MDRWWAAHSSDEAGFWLEIVKEAGLASAGLVEPLLKEADELTAIFARSTMTARQSANRQGRPFRSHHFKPASMTMSASTSDTDA